MIRITEEQRQEIVKIMLEKYAEFKTNNSWSLTDQMEDNYKDGMVDILDSMIQVFGSVQSIYDLANLRNTLEEDMEELDKFTL